jgi:hypothetical protein
MDDTQPKKKKNPSITHQEEEEILANPETD